VLKIVAEGHPGFVLGGFTSNGYGDLSPGHYNLLSCAIIETVLTFFFLTVILGATSAGAPASFAGLAIGLALTLIHLISIRSATPRSIPRATPVRRSSPAKPISNSFGSSCWRRSRAPLWPLSFAGLCRKPG
jgi:aquaporin Z